VIAVPLDRTLRAVLCLLFACSLPALAAPQQPASDPPAPDSTRICVPSCASALPEAVGEEAPISADELRRQNARRLSRSPLEKTRVGNSDGSVSFYLRNLLHAPLTVDAELAEARARASRCCCRPVSRSRRWNAWKWRACTPSIRSSRAKSKSCTPPS
jgi:hypothetical protein